MQDLEDECMFTIDLRVEKQQIINQFLPAGFSLVQTSQPIAQVAKKRQLNDEKIDQTIKDKAINLKKFFEENFNLEEINFEFEIGRMQKQVDKITRDLKDLSKNQTKFYAKDNKKIKLQGVEKTLSYEEKQRLVYNIKQLPKGYLRGIWELVTDKSIFDELGREQQLEFNLDSLGNRKLRLIEKYVQQKLSFIEKSKRQKINKLVKRQIKYNQQIKEKQEEIEKEQNQIETQNSKENEQFQKNQVKVEETNQQTKQQDESQIKDTIENLQDQNKNKEQFQNENLNQEPPNIGKKNNLKMEHKEDQENKHNLQNPAIDININVDQEWPNYDTCSSYMTESEQDEILI